MTVRDSAGAPRAGRLRRPVVLVGMMGSGKTAIGRALAARLGCGFVDSDAAIEEAAKCSIAEIFARNGEPFFRARESEVLSRLLDAGPRVISTGGGAYLAPANRALISQMGAALWLDADLDLLWERVRHKSTRPLLRTADPRGTLARLLEERRPVYEQAELRLVAQAGDSIDRTTSRVIETLAARPDILERHR
ncbi:shikimate kinase [uncultured Limimaricola sp.]|uniref:shikimate kinase n=1 Tax=uncultured Limimaricola sp. TaxID=2211667 RepID=UPI0030F66CC7